MEFWNIFDFLKTFRILDPPWNTRQKKIFEKITPKHVQKHFWTIWERFWAIMEVWKIFHFLKIFRRLDPPWNTGQNNFRKNYLKTCSKHVWTPLRTILGIFGILKIFDFMKTFRRLDPPWNTGQIKFSKKLPQNMFKTRLDTFGNDFGHFWKFWNIFWFFENISKTRPCMEHWAKKLFRKY